jgi:hypothetical protein
MRLIERLLFAQGNRCFFCHDPLPVGDATVEHLVAQSNGGLSADDNCVACCKALNNLLGNKSYKEKLRIMLQHRPRFTCPRPKTSKEETLPPLDAEGVARKRFELVFSKFEKQVRNRPVKLERLRNAIANVFDGQIEDDDVERIIAELQSTGYIHIDGKSVIYQQNGDGRKRVDPPGEPTG